jgi:cobalt-zinc-cadmium resistance protein CzcA
MLNLIIGWSLRNRLVVVAAWLGIVAWGAWSLSHLSIDAFPDTTPVQVQINITAPALSPVEIEQQVTIPVESAISGLAGLVDVRSISKFGLSQVTATFRDGTSVYFARQLVGERLSTIELPQGIGRPEMGPVATGLGEVFHYIVTSKAPGEGTEARRRDDTRGKAEALGTQDSALRTHDSPLGTGHSALGTDLSLSTLTTIHDWLIRPQLLMVPGVAEVNTWGGQKRQFQVRVDPVRLVKHGLTMDDVFTALEGNNASVGGGYIVTAGEASLVQGVALTTSAQEIGEVVITAEGGTPIRVRDVADVEEGHEIRRGAVTYDARGEAVLGLGFMLMGENSHEVTRRLEQRMEELRPTLPPSVDVRIVYRRTELVDRVIETVKENLAVGALLVVAVLFAFLGNVRAGLIVAAAIPLAMLFSFSAMLQLGISASLLSLGAIDFGLVVDSSVIVVENSVRRIGHEWEGGHELGGRESGGPERPLTDIVREASIEVRRPTMFGELIIMIVYLPILLLEGVEGKLFRPMATTVVLALLGSLLFSITLAPVLCSLLLPRRLRERENRLVRAVQAIYRPVVALALRWRWGVVAGGVILIAMGAWLVRGMGTAFIPRLYEEAIAINLVRLAGVSLEESVRYSTGIEALLKKEFPDEVRDVWSRTGTAEVATDPMGLELTDTFITLQPRHEWTNARTQAELTAKMAAAMEGLPGLRMVFTQPIEMRMNEMTAGIRADVGVKIFGDDLDELRRLAAQVQSVLDAIPGSADVTQEQITGQPLLRITVDQEAVARHGVPAEHVLEIVRALGGIKVGEVRPGAAGRSGGGGSGGGGGVGGGGAGGQQRFDLTVVLAEQYRTDPEKVGEILVPTADGGRLPLSRLARIEQTEGPSTVTREWGKRRIVVQCNVRGAAGGLGGFVREAQRRISEDLKLPPGYFVRFGGQFEHLQRASERLMIIVPLALGMVLVLLYWSTGTIRDSLIVLTGAPMAALGGIVALRLRAMDFTISAGVGFVAVCGVSMLCGLVLVSAIRQKIAAGMGVLQAIEETRLQRLRPILMTALVAALGFVPMALNTGVGAEVQRPLATVIIGGVIADNLLTLVMLPAMYAIAWSKRRHDAAP